MKPLAALASALAALLLTGTLPAQTPVPILLNYQGRVVVGTVNFNSPPDGLFKFALVDAAGTTAYWSNDGTLIGPITPTSQPTAAVPLTVTKGLCSVMLGDTALANMTAIPASVFTHPDVRLAVWFDDGTNGPQRLTPDQRIAPSAYLADGSVTTDKIAANAVNSTHIAAGAVGSTQLGQNLALTGTVTAPTFTGAFAGDGSLLGNVNAAAVGGLNASNFWKLGGNDPAFGPHFLGTTDILTGVGAGITMGTDDWLSFYAGGSTRAVITADGNVGIGTTAPGNKLEIAPTATSGYNKDTPTSWNGLTISQRLSHTGSAAGILFQGYNLGPGGITGGVNGKAAIVGRRVGTDEMNLMFLSSSNNGATFTEAITIQHDGNVGIGKTNPGASLDVLGWMRVTDSGPPGPGRLGLELGVHSGSLPSYSWIQSNESRPLALNPQGNHVGIGTAEPGYRLDVVGAVSETPMTNGVIRLVGAGSNPATGFGGGLLFAQQDSLGTYSSYASITGRRVNGVLHNLVDLDFNTGSPLDLLPLATRMTITAAGKVGIGISNPQATLDVNGTVRATNFLGPLNTLANGNIGIGTVTPSTLLHVDGGSEEALLRLETSGAGKAAAIQFKDTFGSSFQHVIGQETAAGHGLLSNSKSRALVLAADGPNAIQFGVNDQVAMTILNGGNVGIGTTDPSDLLHVNGGNSNARLRLETNGVGKAPMIIFKNTSGSSIEHFIGQETTGAGGLLTGDIARALVIGAGGANPIQFGVNDQVAMTILNGGSVGIGTSSPSERLHVAGNIAVSAPNSFIARYDNGSNIYAASLGWNWLQLGNNGGNYIVGGRTATGGSLIFVTNNTNDSINGVSPNGTEVMRLTAPGNVGIGTNDPIEKLHVAGSIITEGTGGSGRIILKGTGVGGHQYEWYPDSPNPGDLGLLDRTAGPLRIVVKADGKVGIGTHTPGEKLEVAGNIKISGAGNMLITPKLAITGGADIAEPFDSKGGNIPEGSAMVIDEAHPGHLKMSDQPYDTRVAGIVSGAGGVNPGLTLSQQGVMEGRHQVALVGRVYARADATTHPIRPGDLLTTSPTPGHLMSVTDRTRAQGAILGKAMTSLESGTGLVLVLVTLQ